MKSVMYQKVYFSHHWYFSQLGQPCRMALHYTETKVDDTVWVIQEGGKWFEAKAKNEWGLDFPNLPYFTDGDVKLTQSDAILRHLGRKHGLYGGSEKQAGHIDMLIDTAKDIKMALIMPNVVMKNLVSVLQKRKLSHSLILPIDFFRKRKRPKLLLLKMLSSSNFLNSLAVNHFWLATMSPLLTSLCTMLSSGFKNWIHL